MVGLQKQWKAIGWQLLLMSLVMLPLHFVSILVTVGDLTVSKQLVTIFLVTWPVILWIYFSHSSNVRSEEVIPGLILVFMISFLGARGLVLPFIDRYLQPELWLPGGHTITRLVGYTLTIGFAQVCTLFFVIRYTVWGSGLRSRKDAVAYCTAVAVSYAFAVNLDWVFASEISIHAITLSIMETQFLQFTGAMTLAFGMSEVRLGKANPIFLAVATISGSLQVGLLITARAGLANASFALPNSSANILFGSLLILIGALLFLGFNLVLFLRAERPPLRFSENWINPNSG